MQALYQWQLSDCGVAELIEQFQDDSGQTYLLAIDPWYYYRLTRNAVNYGYQYDYVDENGRYHDTKVFGGVPLGQGVTTKIREFHVLFQLWLVRILRIFWPDISMLTVAFYSPVIISVLAVVPAFFLARKVAGNTGGFFAGMLVALHPAYLTRTAGGFSDTDSYNVFFPLLIAWLAIEAIDAKSFRSSIIYAALAGLATGLFSFAWKAWYFIFDFMIATGAAVIAYIVIGNWLKNRKQPIDSRAKFAATGLGAYIVSSAVFITLISGFSRFWTFIKGIIDFTQIKDVGGLKIWPNVYTTVAELNPASLSQTISQISLGSKVWLLLALLGLVLPLYASKNRKSLYFAIGSAVWLVAVMMIWPATITSHLIFGMLITLPIAVWIIYSLYAGEQLTVRYSIFLAIWFVATIYASSKGVRFILLLVPAFAVAAGIAVGMLWKWLTDALSSGLSINRTLTGAVMFVLFFGMLWFPTNFVKAGTDTAVNEIPSMNDAWYGALTKINLEAEPDAIINSWWDFGHWFAAVGNRSVTLDGGRQNSPQAHWLGKLMLTWDEDESMGILRYLDCGGNTGFDKLSEIMGNDLDTIHTLYELIPVDRDSAYSILESEGLSSTEIDEVLQYTHCNPPENYFITSEDMVGKSGVWAHFGAWDFDKAVMYNKVINKNRANGVKTLEDDYGMSPSEADAKYTEIKNVNADQWIAPWPSYAGASACTTEATRVVCDNGVIWDLATKDAYVNTNTGQQNPQALVFVEDREFHLKEYDENVIIFPQTGRPLGVAMLGSNGNYRALLMDADLTASMFTRLFYYENSDGGLTHFKIFDKRTDVTGQKIIIWKVDWEGTMVEPQTVDPDMESFVQCISDSGAKFYGTPSCTWCNQEKELLQNSPAIPFIDCQANADACEAARVTAYPTWILGDSVATGYQTIDQLSALTGCQYGTEPAVTTTETASQEFDLVKVSHILISTDNRTDGEALQLAEDIFAMTADSDFDALVDEYSDCSPQTIQCDLGWFGRGVLDKNFEDAAFSLSLGEVSEPVKSKFGYHIMKLTGTK